MPGSATPTIHRHGTSSRILPQCTVEVHSPWSTPLSHLPARTLRKPHSFVGTVSFNLRSLPGHSTRGKMHLSSSHGRPKCAFIVPPSPVGFTDTHHTELQWKAHWHAAPDWHVLGLSRCKAQSCVKIIPWHTRLKGVVQRGLAHKQLQKQTQAIVAAKPQYGRTMHGHET